MPTLRNRQAVVSRSVCGCCMKVFLYGFGGVIATVGILLSILWSSLSTRLMQSQLPLNDHGTTYRMWAETPIPLYFKVYMFNWTNPKTSIRGPEKPMFTQMGPYVFREHYSKKNVVWNDNFTVTYLNQKQWYFMPEMSNGTLNDEVTNLNVIAMTVGWKCLPLLPSIRRIINVLIALEESLIKTDTVGNLLFNGSSDHLLSIFKILRPYIKDLPDMDKFGWLYKRNMSFTGDGVFTMSTGQDNVNKLGLITSWNYKNRTVFQGECGRVHGTYGEEFPPNSVYQDEINLFANDLCSVLNLKRQKRSSVNNIPSVVFGTDEDTLSNKTTCYCATNTSCPASGVRDVSLCNGSPALISWPHFYLADPSYREAVIGMNPDPEKHQFYMNLAEVTSVPLDVRVRIQINILMQSIPNMTLFKDIQRTVMPMMWFEQESTLTPSISSQLRVLVDLINWGRWVLLGSGLLGLLLVLIGIFIHSKGFCQEPDDRLIQ